MARRAPPLSRGRSDGAWPIAFGMETALLIASILGVATAAGVQFPVFLMLPWLLVLWGGGGGMLDGAGGLGGPPAFLMGTLLLVGFALSQPLPWLRRAWELLVGIAGVIAATITPALLVTDDSLAVLPLSVVAFFVAGLIRFERWGQARLPYFRGDPPSALDRKIHRALDAIFAAGLITAGMFVPLVVLIVLPLIVGIIFAMGRSSLLTAWFHLTLARGVFRSLQAGPRWDTCAKLWVAGEPEPLPGPFRMIPALFPGTVGEPARVGRLVLPGEGMPAGRRWFLPSRLAFGARGGLRPRAVLLPAEGREWKRERVSAGHQVFLSGLGPFGIVIVPEGYPETPSVFPRNETGL
jgi:hypothetical protein